MDQTHDYDLTDFPNKQIQNVIRSIINSWQQKYETLRANAESMVLEPKKYPEEGFYRYRTHGLTDCLQRHRNRWTDRHRFIQESLAELFVQGTQHYLSVGQLLALVVIFLNHNFSAGLDPAIRDRIIGLKLVNYNKQLQWPEVLGVFVEQYSFETNPALPEVRAVFESWTNLLLDFLEKRPRVLDEALFYDLTTIRQTRQFDHHFLNAVNDHLASVEVGAEQTTSDPVLECFGQFLSGDFTALETLLIRTQLEIRCVLAGVRRMSHKNKVETFGQGLELVQIKKICSRDEVFGVFQYPQSVDQKKNALFLHCVFVEDQNQQAEAVLELTLALVLFQSDHADLIFEALREYIVDSKVRDLLEPCSTATVQFQGCPFPKKWLKYDRFKKLLQA